MHLAGAAPARPRQQGQAQSVHAHGAHVIHGPAPVLPIPLGLGQERGHVHRSIGSIGTKRLLQGPCSEICLLGSAAQSGQHKNQ